MASRAAAAASALLLLLCLGCTCGEYSSQSLSTFVDTMLAEYDREVPPTERTPVALVLDVRHAAVDDRAATMRLLADLRMSWNDSRLSWNASAWEGDSVLVSAERLWAPDLWLANAGGGGAGDAELRARLTAGGVVAAVRRLDLVVPLALEPGAWPQDTQEAVFKFTARTHPDQIDIIIGDDANSLVVESGSWAVVSVVGEQWSAGRGVSWRVLVTRRGAAQAAAAGAVLVAALLLLAAATALPYSKRAPLAAGAAVLPLAWLLSAASSVPAAASCPRVVRVMCAASVCGATLAACGAAAARVAARAAPPPAALRALLTRLSALYTLAPDPESAGTCKSGAWSAAAQLVDAAVVSATLLTLLVLASLYIFS